MQYRAVKTCHPQQRTPPRMQDAEQSFQRSFAIGRCKVTVAYIESCGIDIGSVGQQHLHTWLIISGCRMMEGCPPLQAYTPRSQATREVHDQLACTGCLVAHLCICELELLTGLMCHIKCAKSLPGSSNRNSVHCTQLVNFTSDHQLVEAQQVQLCTKPESVTW